MKKAKLMLAFILFSILLIIIGECYSMYLYNAEYDFPSMILHFQENESALPKIKIADKLAKENNVEIFMVNRTIENSSLSTKTVYTSEDVRKHLETKAKMKTGLNKSILFSKTKFEYKPLLEYESTNKYAYVFILGNHNDISRFMESFSQYADNPSLGSNFGYKIVYINMFWIIAFSVILLMTIFEIVLLKRNVSVQMIMGEDLNHLVFKHIGIDFVSYLAIMSLSIIVLQPFTNVLFEFKNTIMLFSIFIVINSLLYFTFYFMDIRKNIASKTKSKFTLKVCYVYKFLSVLGCVFVLILCFKVVSKWISYKNYGDFISTVKSYEMLVINTPFEITNESEDDMDACKVLSSDTYLDALSKNKTQTYANLDLTDTYNGTELIYCDSGSEKYIKNQIKEYKDFNFEKKVYFISPQKFNENYDAKKEIASWYSIYNSHDMRDDFELLSYKSKVDFLSFEYVNEININNFKNPVIIFDNRSADQIKNMRDIYLCKTSLCDLSQEEWNSIINRNDVNKNLTYRNNVYESYLNQLNSLRVKGLFSIVLAIVVLLIECFIIKITIRYEFIISGMELVIKKVLGYSLLSKYKKIFKLTLFSVIINFTVLGCYYAIKDRSSLIFVLLGISLFIIIDYIIIGFYIRKMEKINLQKVLNGAII